MQLTEQLESNSAFSEYQNASRKFYSTKRALLVYADLNMAIGKGHVDLLGLMDLSAAFDTADHEITVATQGPTCDVQHSSQMDAVICHWPNGVY